MSAAVVRALFLMLMLYGKISANALSGCEDWDLKSHGKDVCCRKCKPGNRVIDDCGRDPEQLCAPCEHDTYTTLPYARSCLKCTQCIGKQFPLRACTASSDTVCGCKAGFRCGDEKCSFCDMECKIGEEPVKGERSCRKCPDGTFNDKIHSPCRKAVQSCPAGQIMVDGKGIADNRCEDYNHVVTMNVTKRKSPDEKNWTPFYIAGGIILLTLLSVAASAIARIKSQTPPEKPNPEPPNQDESRIMVEEDCSFRRPEQEQGGSSETVHTQDSESKLII